MTRLEAGSRKQAERWAHILVRAGQHAEAVNANAYSTTTRLRLKTERFEWDCVTNADPVTARRILFHVRATA